MFKSEKIGWYWQLWKVDFSMFSRTMFVWQEHNKCVEYDTIIGER